MDKLLLTDYCLSGDKRALLVKDGSHYFSSQQDGEVVLFFVLL